MKVLIIIVFAVALLSSCTPRSKRVLAQPVVHAEKAVIIEANNQASAFHGEEVLTYKVKRLLTGTVTFIQIKVATVYSVNDTILWKFHE